MYSTALRGTSLELVETQKDQSLFNVVLYGRAGVRGKSFDDVYVPSAVAREALVTQGCEVHIATVGPNSLASLLLPGRPYHVMTRVRLKDGALRDTLPTCLKLARRLGLTLSGCTVLLAAWLVWGSSCQMTGFLLGCTASLLANACSRIPSPDKPKVSW